MAAIVNQLADKSHQSTEADKRRNYAPEHKARTLELTQLQARWVGGNIERGRGFSGHQ